AEGPRRRQSTPEGQRGAGEEARRGGGEASQPEGEDQLRHLRREGRRDAVLAVRVAARKPDRRRRQADGGAGVPRGRFGARPREAVGATRRDREGRCRQVERGGEEARRAGVVRPAGEEAEGRG